MKALLALEDGFVLEGRSFTGPCEGGGEVIFNTGMTGYQEILTDPSYYGQMVCMTWPLIGNYGINAEDMESGKVHAVALIVKECCKTPSNWRSVCSLPDFLQQHGVPGIEGIDTRALTRHLRTRGSMRAGVFSGDALTDDAAMLAAVQGQPAMLGADLAGEVSTTTGYTVEPVGGDARFTVAAIDLGIKSMTPTHLAARGIEVHVLPASTTIEEIRAIEPDGVFFSNGPGDPVSVPETVEAVRALLGRLPVFGICLGNQVISMAAGALIEKLPYGHHGGNEPVMNLLTEKVEITAQNHNYGPVFSTLGPLVPEFSGGFSDHVDDLRFWTERRIAPVVMNERYGRVRLTHVNLNDGTPEGLQFLDVPAFSMQYHPEAKPGPNDSTYAFAAFARLMGGVEDYLAIDVREGRRF